MIVNKDNGDIKFDSFIITKKMTIDDFKIASNQFDSDTISKEPDNGICYIKNVENGEISLSLLFNKNRLSIINIVLGNNYNFPPFVITKEEKEILSHKLELLGGTNSYLWGSIVLNEDSKGGVLSILIKYHN